MENTIQQIQKCFQGKCHEFNFPIRIKGTDFHIKVRKLVSQIPYGTSLAYNKVKQEYGVSKMVRAIAFAIVKNPFFIEVHCHCIIGSDGSIVGYSGGRLICANF